MIKHLCILLLLLSSTVYSQSISPLIPYLTNNQLLSRPKVLREMQEEMTKNGDVAKGLNISILSNEFVKLKSKVDSIRVFKIDSTNSSYILSALFLKDSISVEKKNVSADIILNYIKKDASKYKECITPYLILIVQKFDLPTRNIIINGLRIVFEGYNNSNYNIDINDLNKDAEAKNLSKLTDALTKYILGKMENNKITNPKNLNDSITFVSRVNKVFGNVDEEIKDKIITKINTIQDFLENELKDISNWLLSGNMGLGISKSEGEFTGGIQISYNLSTTFQTGIFINNNFKDQSDSLNVKPASLIGFQGRFATENIQADALFSGYFGNTNFKAFKDFEFGIGVSGKLSSLIVGASFYNLISFADVTNYSKVQNLGLYVKTSSRQSPTLYFGIIRDKDGWGNLTVKIIYPINAL